MADIWTKEPPKTGGPHWVRHGQSVEIAWPQFIYHSKPLSPNWDPWQESGWEFGPEVPSPEALVSLVEERDALRAFYEATNRFDMADGHYHNIIHGYEEATDAERERAFDDKMEATESVHAARARVEAIKPQEGGQDDHL